MTKEELALQIVKAMYKGRGQFVSLNAYRSITGYFLDLQMEDLIGIAGQYGIVVGYLDGT